MAENFRMLVVLAHPDDETFGMGGTLAMVARRGVEVYLVCATRGEVGEMDPQYLRGFSSAAERRESELRCAAEKLGLKGVYFLNYRDSGMPGSPDNQHPQALVAQPLDQVTADVVHYIRLLRPQVVLTFDPIGGYRHPDHIAIQRATEKAYQLAGDPQPLPDGLPPYAPQRLFFHLMPRALMRVGIVVMRFLGRDPRKFGTNADIDLVAIAEVDFPTHARISYRPVADIRREASACHASQGGARMSSGLIGFLQKVFASSEDFMQAAPVPTQRRISRDLFEDVHA